MIIKNMAIIALNRHLLVWNRGMIAVLNLVWMEHMVLKFVTEVTDGSGNRPSSSIAKRTDGIALYFSGYIHQKIDVVHVSMSIFYAMKHLFHPACTFTARAALATAFVGVKFGQVREGRNDVRGVIENDDRA